MNTRLAAILAAEDEESEAFILRLAFERSGLACLLIVVRDGQQVVDYLNGSGPFADRVVHPLPSVLILDLKMPRLNGFDVLAWLATRPEFKELPAVVLSSSSDERDIQRARELGARDYFVKPHSLADLTGIIRDLHARWVNYPERSISQEAGRCQAT